MKRLELTDSEWMSIIDGERDGLPMCCANISELRDSLISAARSGGETGFFTRLPMYLDWCFPEHDITPVMQKVIDQMDWNPTGTEGHEKQRMEL